MRFRPHVRGGLASWLLRLATLAFLSNSSSHALGTLRVPQIPLIDRSLQAHFDEIGLGPSATTDQLAEQTWLRATVDPCFSSRTSYSIVLELGRARGEASVFVYSVAPGGANRAVVFPATTSVGWFAVVSFRNSPTRVVIHRFDASAQLQSSETVLGITGDSFGFGIESAEGVWFSEDARNGSGEPHVLGYLGTGLHASTFAWAFESSATSIVPGDFSDRVLYYEPLSDCPTPTNRSSWSRVKAIYR